MKLFIILLILKSILFASIEITQNMKALYKGIELTEVQEDYILDNLDTNIYIFKKILTKEVKQFKNIKEKNIVRFVLTPIGEINNIEFLKTSSNRKLDKATKQAIRKVAKKLIRPNEEVEIRYIIRYNAQKRNYNNYSRSQTSKKNDTYFQAISNGTTRFQHNSKEYVRVFETRKDGFINATCTPYSCASLKLLTIDNQKIHTGMSSLQFNEEVPKGKYKLLVKTRKVCDVHLLYK